MKQAIINNPGSLDYEGNEALNTACTNISFLGADKKKLVITSCNMSEGKSFVAMQIMLNLAKRGKRVVLVDTDLRRSFLMNRFDIRTDDQLVGLSNYLAGYCTSSAIVYETNLYGACFVPIGREVANPIPLLDSQRLPDLLNELAEQFDMVLVDAPPIGMVVDAANIARYCDGCLFVVEYAKRHKRELAGAVRQMQQSNCPVLGCIINKVSMKTLSEKKYYSHHYYGHYGHYGAYYSKPKDDKH